MSSVLRVAVIGLGTMAQSLHLPMFQRRHDRFEIAALVDISPRRREEVAKKWGVGEAETYESVDELVSKIRHQELNIDAAVFAADGVKADGILALIKRGIRVLVEPPVGYGAEDIERIAEFERMAGRQLVMLAYPALYDSSVEHLVKENLARDLRMLEFETLMPATAVMYGRHHVTSAAYDLTSEQRSERRERMQAAVLAGTGDASNQRDRDLYVKGILTGLLAQLALLRRMYGPLDEMHGVRQWPRQVIPGSLEVQGAIKKGPHVRFAWHYLPFAPEFHDSVRFVATRRQGVLTLPDAADLDARGTYTMTHKSDGAIQKITKRSEHSAMAGLVDAFYEFAARGGENLYGLREALADTEIARAVLGEIVAADGRSLEAEPEPEPLVEEIPAPQPIDEPRDLEDIKAERAAAREKRREQHSDNQSKEQDGAGEEKPGGQHDG